MLRRTTLEVFAQRCCFYATWLVIPLCVFILLDGHSKPLLPWIAAAILFISFIWLTTVIASLLFFPYAYSLLGKAKRNRWVSDKPALLSLISGFSTGNWLPCQPSSMFRYRLYRQVLEIRIFPIGKVFLPLSSIQKLEKRNLPSHFAIYHTHSEIRSPINFTSKKLFLALGEVLKGVLPRNE